jgi:hypothetical protein
MLCEFRFEHFNARGEDHYLDEFARRLEALFAAGWIAPDIDRNPTCGGWWQIVLFKDRTAVSQDAGKGK